MTQTGTRDAILDAAERLLGTRGYTQTTVGDIATVAGIGKRTVYVHFPSKDEVVLCTIDRIVDRLLARLRAAAESGGPAPATLRGMLLDRVLFRFDSVRDYSHGLDELFASLRPAYLARRGAYFAAEAGVFAGVVEAGHGSGAFHAPDPAAAAEGLLFATNSLLPYALSARELGERAAVEARAGRVADLLLLGLCRRPPHPRGST